MSDFRRLHARIGALADVPLFFIGGSMKSGTTWLQLLLDAHPRIMCKGEAHLTNHLAPLLLTSLEKHNQFIADKNRHVFAGLDGFPLYAMEDLAHLVAAALLLAFAKSDPPGDLQAIGEKTPDNVRYFEVLRTIFPAAKFIHVVRDGRDCAVSGWFHNLRVSPEWTRARFSSQSAYAATFAAEWADDLAHAARFTNAHPDAVIEVRYEALLADPMAALGAVTCFLGVATDTATAWDCCQSAAFARLSGGRQPGQECRDSFFRNGRQGDWRAHFDPAASEAFAAAAGTWLERLGYL